MKPFRYALSLLLFAVLLAGCDSSDMSGPDEPEYHQATITSVVLLDMPFAKSNGASWDPSGGGGPDVYFGLYDGNDEWVKGGTAIDGVGPSSLPLSWGVEYTIYNLNEQHAFGFWDDDYDANDYISGLSFTLSDYKEEHPPSITLHTSSDLKIKIRLEWAE